MQKKTKIIITTTWSQLLWCLLWTGWFANSFWWLSSDSHQNLLCWHYGRGFCLMWDFFMINVFSCNWLLWTFCFKFVNIYSDFYYILLLFWNFVLCLRKSTKIALNKAFFRVSVVLVNRYLNLNRASEHQRRKVRLSLLAMENKTHSKFLTPLMRLMDELVAL